MKHLSDYTETKQTELLKKLGVFFAFSQSQFLEQRIKGVKYYSYDGGFICPQGKQDQLFDGLEKINEEGIREDVKENGAEAIIEREYWNLETQISGNRTNLKESLHDYFNLFPELFTEEIFNKSCQKAFNKAIDNDWF